MVKQWDRLGRALRNDREVYASIRDALSAAPIPPVFRTHHNAKYGKGEFLAGMARAAASNGTLAAAARRLRRARGGKHPDPEWCRERLASSADGQAGAILAVAAKWQLPELARAVGASGICPVAVDKHDIARWDGLPGRELVRPREKSGTRFFESVMTAQCVRGGLRLTLAMEAVGPMDDVPCVLRRLIGTVKSALEGTGLRPVLLMGRGFPGVEALRVLREERTHYCMMVRRTGNVVDAIDGHAAGSRGRVPAAAMESRVGHEHYIAVIKPRRDAAPPRERFVAFAVSAPWVDARRYAMRWMTGSWYRELERARIRTATTNPAGRALCMAYSLIMLNAWAVVMAMAMAMAGLASRVAIKAARITHSEFCDAASDMAEQGTLLPEPPPVPP